MIAHAVCSTAESDRAHVTNTVNLPGCSEERIVGMAMQQIFGASDKKVVSDALVVFNRDRLLRSQLGWSWTHLA